MLIMSTAAIVIAVTITRTILLPNFLLMCGSVGDDIECVNTMTIKIMVVMMMMMMMMTIIIMVIFASKDALRDFYNNL